MHLRAPVEAHIRCQRFESGIALNERMENDVHMTGRFCEACGHRLDPSWKSCPYCKRAEDAREPPAHSKPEATKQRPLNNLRIFLCHTSADKDFVRRLAHDLWTLDVIPWLDEWNLEPGDSIHENIGEALDECAFVAVILSPESVSSNWVKKELRQALSREDRTGEKSVIPILYRSVKPPPFLEDKLYVDFQESYLKGLGRLACLVHKLDKRVLSHEFASHAPTTKEELLASLQKAGWRTQTVTDIDLYEAIQELYHRCGFGEVSPDVFRIIAERHQGAGSDDEDTIPPPVVIR